MLHGWADLVRPSRHLICMGVLVFSSLRASNGLSRHQTDETPILALIFIISYETYSLIRLSTMDRGIDWLGQH